MSVETILHEIDKEIANLTQARDVLASLNGSSSNGTVVSTEKERFTAASRRKMAAAQKRRWAAFHAAKSKGTGKLTLVQPKAKRMSPAARKRIAAAQRARWAKLKATKKTS
jgi:hypothetical protein